MGKIHVVIVELVNEQTGGGLSSPANLGMVDNAQMLETVINNQTGAGKWEFYSMELTELCAGTRYAYLIFHKEEPKSEA